MVTTNRRFQNDGVKSILGTNCIMMQYFGFIAWLCAMQIKFTSFYVIMDTLISRVLWYSFMVVNYGTLALVLLQSSRSLKTYLMMLIMVLVGLKSDCTLALVLLQSSWFLKTIYLTMLIMVLLGFKTTCSFSNVSLSKMVVNFLLLRLTWHILNIWHASGSYANCFPYGYTTKNNSREWIILCHNIRGIILDKKWNSIKNKIQETKYEIICLQETKRESFDAQYL
jgi:hypothetical protein